MSYRRGKKFNRNKRAFSRTASRVNGKNRRRNVTRGGYRI